MIMTARATLNVQFVNRYDTWYLPHVLVWRVLHLTNLWYETEKFTTENLESSVFIPKPHEPRSLALYWTVWFPLIPFILDCQQWPSAISSIVTKRHPKHLHDAAFWGTKLSTPFNTKPCMLVSLYVQPLDQLRHNRVSLRRFYLLKGHSFI